LEDRKVIELAIQQLQEQRRQLELDVVSLQQKLNHLSPSKTTESSSLVLNRTRKAMSVEGRRRISEVQKARWQQYRSRKTKRK